MKKRMIALLLVLVLAFFTACSSNKTEVLTQEEAIQVALEDAGVEDYDEAHTHVTNHGSEVCYSVHITIDGTEYEYLISATSGEILHADDIA